MVGGGPRSQAHMAEPAASRCVVLSKSVGCAGGVSWDPRVEGEHAHDMQLAICAAWVTVDRCPVMWAQCAGPQAVGTTQQVAPEEERNPRAEHSLPDSQVSSISEATVCQFKKIRCFSASVEGGAHAHAPGCLTLDPRPLPCVALWPLVEPASLSAP